MPQKIEKDIDFICKKTGVRVYGSSMEKQLADYIASGFKKSGLQVDVQEFPVKCKEYARVDFRCIHNGKERSIEALPFNLSGMTQEKGMVLELERLENTSKAAINKKNLAGKAVLLFEGPGENYDDYRNLVKAGIKAAIIIDNRYPVSWPIADSLPYFWMGKDNPPAISISYLEAEKLIEEKVKKIFLRLTGKDFNSVSQNVIGLKKGTGNENIVVCAHHDSVRVGEGAVDNGTGVSIIMELARKFSREKPGLRNILFVSFGAEEVLSYGSFNFVKKHLDSKVENTVFTLNFDGGNGSFMGKTRIDIAGEENLLKYIQEKAGRKAHYYSVTGNISPYSDQFPFNVAGIPSAWIRRHNTQGGYYQFHSKYETTRFIDIEILQEVVSISFDILKDLSTREKIPFQKKIPADLQETISLYHKTLCRNWLSSGKHKKTGISVSR